MKSIKKKLFFLDVPIYEREICVVVGMNHEQAVRAAKKQKCTKNFMEALNWETAKELCNKVNGKESQTEGAAVRVNEKSFFLFIQPYENNWKYFDILNHECFHLTQFMSSMLNIWDETEPPAYLHTWLVKRLRRVLGGTEK